MFLLVMFVCNQLCSQAEYGDNKEIGRFIEINGLKHYYEVYGEGTPLLLIHGNSTGIKGMAAQIQYFSKKYKVYTIDCRGRGRSELGKDSLSYLQTANDMSVFIRQLNLDSVYILGKSDGGVVALLMAIYYPERIKKIVAFGANVQPDSSAFYPVSLEKIHGERLEAEAMIAKKDTSKNWTLIRQCNRLMEFQPHITAAELQKIQVPVLVMSCDRDLIKTDHTMFIYRNIPKAGLCILNGETHSVPRLNPDLFNTAAEKFLSQPYQDDSVRFKRR